MIGNVPTPSRLSLGSFRRAAILAAVMSALFLSGCSNSDFSLTADDAIGTWRAGSDLPAQLELAEDGGFTATDWPLDVRCNGKSPLTVDALHGAETGDFTGTWEEGGATSASNDLLLYPEGDACPTYVITAGFRSEEGVKYACMKLGVPNEDSSAENFFILYLGEPAQTPKSDACFSYN